MDKRAGALQGHSAHDHARVVPGVGSGSLHQGPFEPLATCLLKHLTWKTVFLLAIVSAYRVSEMHALSCEIPYLRVSNAGVTLFTKLSFGLKVATRECVPGPIFVPTLHNHEDRALRRLCV